MKKLLAALLCLVMILGLFAGCNKGGNKDNNEIPTDEQGRQIITIGLPQDVAVTDYETNAYTLWLEEKSGYNIEFQYFASASADYKTQLATMLINENERLPDILWGFKGLGGDVWRLYGEDGYFIDLTDYIMDKEGAAKTWWDQANLLGDDYIDSVLTKCKGNDGKIYAFPCIEQTEVDTMEAMPFINKTWLTELGLDMPHDLKSLKEVLIAFRDKDPNGNGEKDEIPLVCQKSNGGTCDAVQWIINMFLYFDKNTMFALSEDGQTLTVPFTSDKYREALIFLRELKEEGLLHPSVFTMGKSEFNSLLNPTDGPAKIGVALAHPTLCFTVGENSVYDYAAMPFWGHAVRRDNTVQYANFITEDAEDPDACWNLMMIMASEESAIRMRYGQEGVDWEKADEGSKSFLGYDAKIKILRDDAFSGMNNQTWHSIDCCILMGAENEYVQYDGAMDKWLYAKNGLMGDIVKNFKEAEKNNSPKYILPDMYLNKEEELLTEDIINNCKSTYRSYSMAFVIGANKLDPRVDADWQKYINQLNTDGLADWLAQYQRIYDANYKAGVLD